MATGKIGQVQVFEKQSYSQASNNTTQQNNSSSALNHAEILSNVKPRRGNVRLLERK